MICICERSTLWAVKLWIIILLVPLYLGIEEGDIRLEGGQYDFEGRVEIYHKGEWGTVCDDGGWNNTHARIVCRQLGLSYDGIATDITNYGEGKGTIWFEGVYVECTGDEERLQNCTIIEWNCTYCFHYFDAGVICNGIRLVNGTSKYMGRVEVYDHDGHSGSWGAISDDDWTDKDASVVCRQLGLGGEGRAILDNKNISIRSYNILCDGSERYLDECSQDTSDHVYTYGNAVGVHCIGLRLENGISNYEGRLEIHHNGRWGTVCNDYWDENDASVACRQLGYSDIGTATTDGRFGKGNDVIWLDDVDCNGHESSLLDCKHSGWENHNCGHGEDVGIRCNVTRLVGDDSLFAGRVEMYQNGAWRTVCSSDWTDTEARVVCRELGLANNGRRTNGASFGRNNGTIWPKAIHCKGNEDSLQECNITEFVDNNCTPDDYAGVICYDENSCTNIKCLNGGRCIVQPNGYICGCNDGFQGLNCANKTNSQHMHGVNPLVFLITGVPIIMMVLMMICCCLLFVCVRRKDSETTGTEMKTSPKTQPSEDENCEENINEP